MVQSSSWGKMAVTVPKIHLEMVEMVSFMICIFCHNFKNRFPTTPFEQHKHPIHPQGTAQRLCLWELPLWEEQQASPLWDKRRGHGGQDPGQVRTRDSPHPGQSGPETV